MQKIFFYKIKHVFILSEFNFISLNLQVKKKRISLGFFQLKFIRD